MGQSNLKARCLRRARFTTGRIFGAFVWADLLLPGARVSGATQINCWVLPVVRRSGGTQEPKAHTHTSTPETWQQWRQPGSHNPWCPERGGDRRGGAWPQVQRFGCPSATVAVQQQTFVHSGRWVVDGGGWPERSWQGVSNQTMFSFLKTIQY